jgi:hypothetical protein
MIQPLPAMIRPSAPQRTRNPQAVLRINPG